MRPLQALVLLPLAGALLSDPGAELWAGLTAVQWPPVPFTEYRSVQLASLCQCRAACVADPRCQALRARLLDAGGYSCSLASRRRGAALPAQPPPAETGGWFERAGPATPELVCWPEHGHCRPPTDCAELRRAGVLDSGVFNVSVSERAVFCDMETDGGGWTLLQRRGTPPDISFSRTLTAYTSGFGQAAGDHWLGLATAARLADLRPQLLRVDGWTQDKLRFAVYGPIALAAADGYSLTAPHREGNATAQLVTAGEGVPFRAVCESDSLLTRTWNCNDGGWWSVSMYSLKETNLNGVTQVDGGELLGQWVTDSGTTYHPTRSEIKLRDADFQSRPAPKDEDV